MDPMRSSRFWHLLCALFVVAGLLVILAMSLAGRLGALGNWVPVALAAVLAGYSLVMARKAGSK